MEQVMIILLSVWVFADTIACPRQTCTLLCPASCETAQYAPIRFQCGLLGSDLPKHTGELCKYVVMNITARNQNHREIVRYQQIKLA
jgi:hypothetical protein